MDIGPDVVFYLSDETVISDPFDSACFSFCSWTERASCMINTNYNHAEQCADYLPYHPVVISIYSSSSTSQDSYPTFCDAFQSVNDIITQLLLDTTVNFSSFLTFNIQLPQAHAAEIQLLLHFHHQIGRKWISF